MRRPAALVLSIAMTSGAFAKAQPPKPPDALDAAPEPAPVEVVVVDPGYAATSWSPPPDGRWAPLLSASDLEEMHRYRRRARLFWGLSGLGAALFFAGVAGLGASFFAYDEHRANAFFGLAVAGMLGSSAMGVAGASATIAQARWIDRQGCPRVSRFRAALALTVALAPGAFSVFAALPGARQMRRNERGLLRCRAAQRAASRL